MAGETVLDKLVVQYAFRGDERGLRRIEERVARAKKRMSSFANVTAIGGAALTGILGKIGKTVYNFETEINALRAATNAADDDMAEMRLTALRLGEETQFSASQAASAMKLLGQAGLSTEEILGAIPRVLALAAAGGLDMATSAEISTSLLKGFGLRVDELGRLNDVLAVSAASAKTTVRDMGTALARAAPLAREAGISLEDMAANVAVLQDLGIQAEEAGTAMRNMLLRIANASGPALEAYDALGLSAEETYRLITQGKLQEVLSNFRQAGLDLKSAGQIFGARVAGPILGLNKNEEALEKLVVALQNAEGAAERMAAQRMMGLPGAILRLVSKLESLQIALGDAGVTGAIIRMSQWIVNIVSWFRSLSPEVQETIAHIIALGPALLAASGAIKVLTFTLGPLIFMLKLLFGVMAMNPVSLIIIGIALLVAALAGMIYYWDEIKAAIVSAVMFIGDHIVAAAGMLVDAWQWAVGNVGDTFDFLSSLWADTLSWLTDDPVGNAFEWIKENWLEILKFLALPQLTLFEWIRDAFKWVMDKMLDVIPGPLKRFFGIESGEDMELPAKGILDSKSDMERAVESVTQGMRDRIPSSDAKIGPLSDLTESGRGFITTIASGIRDAAPLLAGAIHEGLGGTAPLLGSLAAPLPIGPPAAAIPGLAGAGGGPTSISLTIGEVRIDAPGADANEVAQNLSTSLQTHLEALTYSADSRVAR